MWLIKFKSKNFPVKNKFFWREIGPWLKVQNPLITPLFQRKLHTKLGFWDILIFWKFLLGRRKPKDSKLLRCLNKSNKLMKASAQLLGWWCCSKPINHLHLRGTWVVEWVAPSVERTFFYLEFPDLDTWICSYRRTYYAWDPICPNLWIVTFKSKKNSWKGKICEGKSVRKWKFKTP